MNLPSMIPGIVQSYDAAKREIRVRIPGVTDGSSIYPIAEISNALGDKSEHTEIRILAGDRVWLMFKNGDPDSPIIVGYRTKRTGNVVGYRRWHHDNIESDADTDQMHTAGNDYGVHAGHDYGVLADNNVDIEAGVKITKTVGSSTIEITSSLIKLSCGGSIIEMDAAGIRMTGARIDLN